MDVFFFVKLRGLVVESIQWANKLPDWTKLLHSGAAAIVMGQPSKKNYIDLH
jgi:hypothetical protein